MREVLLAIAAMTRKKSLFATALAVMAVSIVVPYQLNAPVAQAAPANFVYRDGKNLMLNGKPYKFVGYNYFGLTGCAHGAVSNATMERYFSGLRPQSTTRVWAFRPQGMDGVLRTVAVAEKYNQKVIFALGDGAQYCSDTGYNAAFYQSGYRGTYFNWVSTVASQLKNSPAVLGYETMNEPCHTGAGGVSAQNMKDFFQNTASYIKSIDPNHLVFSGSLAPYDCGGALRDFAFVHSGDAIDGGSLHEYDYLSVGQRGASSHWSSVKSGLDSINKVSYVGETGVGPDGGCLSDSEMASAHKAKLDGYMNAGASGVLVWGFDDQKVCGIYSGRQITFGSATEAMFKSYTNSNMTTPASGGSGSTSTPVPATATPAPTANPSGVTTVNDSVVGTGVNQFNFSGGWQVSNGEGKSAGDDHYASAEGDTAVLNFSGRQVKLYGSKAPHHGIMAISIDGGSEVMVDAYAADRQEQTLLFTSATLASGNHTLKVRVTGDKNVASSGTVVALDKAEVSATSAGSTGPQKGDLNNDGVVNIMDLSILLSNWGN